MSSIFVFFQKKKNCSYNISNYKANNIKLISLGKNNIDYTKNFPPANSEWSNSIYAFNKKTIRHLPIADKMVIKLIKSYFYLFSPKYENKISSIRLRIRLRRLSINRIFVSKADLKHSNSKVIITLYIYNRQKKYFLNKLKFLNKIGKKNEYILKKWKEIKLQATKIINLINKEKTLFADILEWGFDSFKNIEDRHYEDFIKKSLEKEMLKVYYKNLLYFNKSKFENTYLLKLKTLVSKIYKKKVEFNIVNLEYLHLNSDILSESIAIKLRNRKNKLLRILKTSLKMVKLPYIDKLNIKYDLNKIKLDNMLLFNNIQNLNTLLEIYLDKYKNKDVAKDGFNELLFKIFPFFIISNMKKKEEIGKEIEYNILNSISNKSISGIRLEATGRLSRRFTAAKSIFKFKYKGSLKNIHSSYKGLSSVILRGHAKSNIQYTNINSKTRNGSFGIKGWVSSI
jgi:hypothetical protein